VSVTDEPEFARWFEQAETAASVAALASSAGHFQWACFLAEQAAQFSVKGLLHGIGVDAWGHDLAVLVARVTESIGEPWPPTLAEPAARLSRHYIPARYPDAHASGTPGAHYTEERG
jgi:HEPN domain-containing protein